MNFKKFGDYLKHVRQVIAHEAVINHYTALTHNEKGLNTTYALETKPDQPLLFIDGAELRFRETVTFERGTIEWVAYSISYTLSDGFYFRYDKDPQVVRPDHPLCHLHLKPYERNLRLVTHSTHITEIFNLIVATFYP